VRCHQAVAEALPTLLAHHSLEHSKEGLTIFVIAKDRQSSYATGHEVIERAGILQAWWASHLATVDPRARVGACATDLVQFCYRV